MKKVIADKLNIENLLDIHQCHHMGKHKYNCPRRIMFKFNKFKEEQKTLRNEKKKKTLKFIFMKTFAKTQWL